MLRLADLKLISTTDTTDAFSDEGYVYLEPSVFLASYGEGYEFRGTRDEYADPVKLTKTVIRGKKRTTTKVPAELVDGFNGFKNGLTTTVKTPKGKVLSSQKQPLCPGGWDNQRIDATGPSEPVYPTYCRPRGSRSPVYSALSRVGQ